MIEEDNKMIELYAWANIWGDELQEDEYSCYSRIVEPLIKSKLNEFHWLENPSLGIMNFQYLNGELTLNVILKTNRFKKSSQDVFDIFNYIAEIAKGSYGLIYMYDSENLKGKDNVFQVFVLKDGALKEAIDPFLSPILPDID